MTTQPNPTDEPYRPSTPTRKGTGAGPGVAPPPFPAEQLALDEHDPDAMDDRAARLRAELERLDVAKLHARDESLSAITDAAATHRATGTALDDAVAEARAYGATWQQIGDAAGLVKSAAWERWATRG